MGTRMVILRSELPQYERSVRVSCEGWGPGALWNIDPEAEISRIVGMRINREGCILSFAAGLKAAGADVFIDDRRKNKQRSFYKFQFPKGPVGLAFFLVGLAGARDSWLRLKTALEQNVAPHNRFRVLEATAEYMYDHPEQELKLVIPV